MPGIVVGCFKTAKLLCLKQLWKTDPRHPEINLITDAQNLL